MFPQLNEYLKSKTSITEEELVYVNSLFIHRKVKKKEELLTAGQKCDFEAFVIKGLFRTYYVNEKGDEIDLFFSCENWWISDLVSFSQQIPSKLYIQALEDSEVLSIKYDKKEDLFRKLPAFERVFRLLVQKSYETITHRLIATISDTAEQRYLDFLKKYPSLPQRLPQHMIASYIGVSPEFLSRMRARKIKIKSDF